MTAKRSVIPAKPAIVEALENYVRKYPPRAQPPAKPAPEQLHPCEIEIELEIKYGL
jgi:hypothetical protein